MPRLSDLQRISYPAHPSSVDWSDIGQDFEQRLAEALQQLVRDFEETIVRSIQDSFAEAMASAFRPLRELLAEWHEFISLLERAAEDPHAADQLLERLKIDRSTFAKYSDDPQIVHAALVLALREVAAQWHERQLVWLPWEGRLSKVGKVRPGDLPLPYFGDWLIWRTTQRAVWWLKGWTTLDIEAGWARHEQRWPLQDIAADQGVVEDLAIRAVDAEWLLTGVRQAASPTQRLIIECLRNELTIDEIADILQVAPATVRSQLHRLRRKFLVNM